MTGERQRAGAGWLALREAADASARDPGLVETLQPRLPSRGTLTVHDLGCGTGSMARWLAPRLTGRQHWVLHDRDPDLLALAGRHVPGSTADGSPVTVETRRGDVTRLEPGALGGADLVTASALLDVLTHRELDRLVVTCASARCPVLLTLSVTGQVELDPGEPLDARVGAAFNAHQRRTTTAGVLLGPDAAGAAAEGLTRAGLEVLVRPSPWRLGAGQAALATEWFTGWLSAACEQDPGLRAEVRDYEARRRAEATAGRLAVTVQHLDLLALPR